MKTTWRTLWRQNEIVVCRDGVEVDHLSGERIARVLLVYRGQGDMPGDVVQSVVELADDDGYAILEPLTGFADRVNFERQSFWRDRRGEVVARWPIAGPQTWEERKRLRVARSLPFSDLVQRAPA